MQKSIVHTPETYKQMKYLNHARIPASLLATTNQSIFLQSAG
jgi:hypothetical protein